MTVIELREFLNKEFGLNEWPIYYEVDSETYANVVQYLINLKRERSMLFNLSDSYRKFGFMIVVGPNGGPYFKNVELILRANSSNG